MLMRPVLQFAISAQNYPGQNVPDPEELAAGMPFYKQKKNVCFASNQLKPLKIRQEQILLMNEHLLIFEHIDI